MPKSASAVARLVLYNSRVSIQEIWGNIKRFFRDGDTHILGLIFIVGIGSFLLGRMSVESVAPGMGDRQGVGSMVLDTHTPSHNESAVSAAAQKAAVPETGEGGYVASKNGTKYHLPWCGSAKQIKEENKIWFETKEAAEAAGYSPASNCKGI